MPQDTLWHTVIQFFCMSAKAQSRVCFLPFFFGSFHNTKHHGIWMHTFWYHHSLNFAHPPIQGKELWRCCRPVIARKSSSHNYYYAITLLRALIEKVQSILKADHIYKTVYMLQRNICNWRKETANCTHIQTWVLVAPQSRVYFKICHHNNTMFETDRLHTHLNTRFLH